MKKKLFGFLRSDQRGLALISVLGVVTLATILILALFSVSDSEFKASQIYRDGENARHLADSAVNMVIGQIQAAATGAGLPASGSGAAPVGSTIWASQPGAVRVYNSSGKFELGRTLYSSKTMVWPGGIIGEKKMAMEAPSPVWATSLDQWVDLNRPVERATAGAATVVHFPIFDPRATQPVGGGAAGVEGFQILPQSIGSSSVSSSTLGVVIGGAAPATWRLPMPVEWLYVLKDGSVGTVVQPAGGEGQWAGAGGAGPTDLNPIIGRVGFWTDDECCKININTAGEPGFWSQVGAMHERERSWADSPPALFEYQRYPGHPATVALSSVLAPGFNPNNYFPPPSVYPLANLAFKNSIYEFVPKLAVGGTNDGTVPFAPNDLALGASQTAPPDKKKLNDTIMAAK
ncbi:MAG: Verru Chthon cassette protein [Verrucomicrobiaceae bacterium]|nr:Verru Chthon cassette protein [Verrucomicrobiaceae bacterium]